MKNRVRDTFMGEFSASELEASRVEETAIEFEAAGGASKVLLPAAPVQKLEGNMDKRMKE